MPRIILHLGIAAIASASDRCDEFCHQQVGPASYCKMGFPRVCHGTEIRCCNDGDSTTVSTESTRSATDRSFVESLIDTMNSFCRANFGPESFCRTDLSPPVCHGTPRGCALGDMAPATPVRVTPASSPALVRGSNQCESLPTETTRPMFLWVEGTELDTFSDFERLYERLAAYVLGNCVNMRTVRLIIRVGKPLIHANLDRTPLYWPPQTSPIFTVLSTRLSAAGLADRVKIMFYPYIFGNEDRDAWISFAGNRDVNPRSNIRVSDRSLSVYDGIYSFVHGWQEFVNPRSNSIEIEGYTIDYEELKPGRLRGDRNVVTFNNDQDFQPYRSAYPMIKSGISVGYDDQALIRSFAGHIDYIFVQVYDLYYPEIHADRNRDTSIFVRHNENPRELSRNILDHVLTPGIQSVYEPYLDRIFLMWSTQYTTERNCLYPVGHSRTCGINYEIHSTPYHFNEFINHITAGSHILSRVQHGVYTFNFLQESWMPRSWRD